MITANFLSRSLSVNQRQHNERRKLYEQQEARAKADFSTSVNETIAQNKQAIEKAFLEDYYKFRISSSECFTSTPCLCQVLDTEELYTFKDHTRGFN